jgi:Rrf2 family transcriptional regulator, iron-sulfur cluster assembly transcription factor
VLTITSQYALRALTQLAKQGEQGSMLGKELAQKAQIPPNYLAKILLSLKNAGLLNTARGSKGGYWLARDARSIHLIEIVKLFEQSATPQPCILGQQEDCLEDGPCAAHDRWQAIREAYMEFLESTTIADLTSDQQRELAGTAAFSAGTHA